MLHNEFASQEVYTWSKEMLGREEEEGMARGRIIGAEGDKVEEGGGMLVKTPVVVTPTLSSSGVVEEVGASAAEAGVGEAGAKEEGIEVA